MIQLEIPIPPKPLAMWLRVQTNIPGLPMMGTPQTQYGVQVLLLGGEVGRFKITLKTELGEVVTEVEKKEMPIIWVVWFEVEQQTVTLTVERIGG